ncbi:MAG: putative Ribonuclease [Candidatus Saccharibacteria bacterium]|nr:putative Ribonuclease [Candidatus Saccharibacteria bacterium]
MITASIVGIDEVGRGCWAGPVVAGAVILSEDIGGLKDSKKLSKKQREALASLITDTAVSASLGWVPPAEVDEIGLTAAVRLAMKRAVAEISVGYEKIIIDGSFNFLTDNLKASTLIKADDLIQSVSAASIIAKVARDNYMAEQAKLYPGYGFENHVGYGTKQHLNALLSLGVTPLHRLSYKPVRATMQP